LLAYRHIETDSKGPIGIDEGPVEVFEGTLAQACAEAGRLNSKDKLPMTKRDKLKRAWKMVAIDDGNLSKAQIALARALQSGPLLTCGLR
jgi:hypothetical protein